MECSIRVSVSEVEAPSASLAGSVFLKRLRSLVKRSWDSLRQSRLGLTGAVIVLVFAFIAILAPWISPYPKSFEAPASDRFIVDSYNLTLPLLPAGSSYGVPVMGPTTPLSSDRSGGMWEINYAGSGFVRMDLLRYSLGLNVSPFRAGNVSLWLDVNSDFAFNPPLDSPLTSIYYIVPGKNLTPAGTPGSFGPGTKNGLLAFFAGRDFAVVEPFLKQAVFRDRLGFTPVYTGEDPASSGNLLVQSVQQPVCIGIACFSVGPYRYFFASDLNHTVVYEITYVHAGDALRPSGRPMFQRNVSLSAPPFVYYNQQEVTPFESYRAGPGAAVLLPLTNNTLEILNVTGTHRAWVPLSLGGEPATVRGEIGFTRAAFPMQFYLPLRSASHTGLAFFNLASRSLVPGRQVAFADASWEPLGLPVSTRGETVYIAFYRASNDTTLLIGLNATAAVIPQFHVTFNGRLRDYFEVDARNSVWVYTAERKIMFMETTFATSQRVVPALFGVIPAPTVPHIVNAGAFGGTLFGSSLSPQEVNGGFTDPASRQTTVFQLLGTTRAPLPPGTYPSGNRYLLGTDFIGHDILTLIFHGTQIAFLVGLLAALFGVGIGTIIGLIAGYNGGIVDTILMRLTDVFLVLPFLPVVLILDSILRPSVWTIILVLSLLGWPGIARVIRAQALSLRERPFVDAARVSGASDMRLIFLHIAPNVLPFSFLYMSLTVAGAIITEAALSFLGLGDATVVSWGGILSNVITQGGALVYWWWLLPPGLCITLLSLGFYLLGRGFDEIINPRLRRR
jgi:peptide/nickel transport system permease protein